MKKNVIIAIVGAGCEAVTIYQTLSRYSNTVIKYICDPNENAALFQIAKASGKAFEYIPSWHSLIKKQDVEIIFDLTDDEHIYNGLAQHKPHTCQLVGPTVAKVIAKALSEHDAKVEEQTKYLLHATHQLKAPFAAIQSYTDIIQGGYAGEVPKDVSKILNKINIRCNLLSESIKDMLTLASLTSNTTNDLMIECVSLKSVISNIIKKVNSIAKKQNIKINIQLNISDDRIETNLYQLEMLFSVLIENAISYSLAGSEVDITALERANNTVEVSIKDQGIGIAPTNHHKVFLEYFRTNEAAEHNQNGNGLGLAIVKKISDIHNFEINLKSELGKGTTFTILMPKRNKLTSKISTGLQ
ncbi:MAG: HAMP domain-containing histidine kinase [Bacteriovoracaceae bacterium]|nr:HAMP domain-containing histidine kinase [Bacteriovoracaceae bacterium]